MPRKKSRTQKQPTKAKVHFKRLIVTFNEMTGEVAKLEVIGPTGKPHALSDVEIARLLGNDELHDLHDVLEDAYAAGIRDGIDDALSNYQFGEGGLSHATESEEETVGGRILQSGVRRFVLRQALRRGAVRRQSRTEHNGANDAP